MIVPSIDLEGGNAVQLVGGEKRVLNAGDPLPIARQFSLAGEMAVIDLDAALSKGSNEQEIRKIVQLYPCRVGGGIRTLSQAVSWLDAGASKIILGTKAVPEILAELPKARVIAALDAREGEVVVEGWTKPTGRNILERIRELKEYVGGFLITFVEREGRMSGTRLDLVPELVAAASPATVTIAGGITTAQEIAEIDKLGADAQVGMAIYTQQLHLADCIAAPLRSERADGLWPTLVCDERGVALGLAWSSSSSLRLAVEELAGVYHSRKRGIWKKGSSSGHIQELLSITLDCDRDALRFQVRQKPPGFCHNNTATCFGNHRGLSALEGTLLERQENPMKGSYVNRLLGDPQLLDAKIMEEAKEFIEARTAEDIIEEAADLLFFTLTRLRSNHISLSAVEDALDRRARAIVRRPGNAKE